MSQSVYFKFSPNLLQFFFPFLWFHWVDGLFEHFSDEEESEEKKRITEERLKAYHEKKSKKAAVIAKTSVLLDVKVGSNF